MNNFEKLAQHIIVMADDSYLAGHPEWHELVNEAKNCFKADKRSYNIALLKENQNDYDMGLINKEQYEYRINLING